MLIKTVFTTLTSVSQVNLRRGGSLEVLQIWPRLAGEGQTPAGEDARQKAGWNALLPVPHHALVHLGAVHLSLRDPLCLRSPVLEPDLHLRLRQLELRGELGPLGDAEVGLRHVLLLEPVQLLVGERGAGLPVRPVLPQGALEGQVVHWGEGWGGGGKRRRLGRKVLGGSGLLQLFQKQQLGEGGGKLWHCWGGERSSGEGGRDAVSSVEVLGRRRGGGVGGGGGWARGAGVGRGGRWWGRVEAEIGNPFTFDLNLLLLWAAVVRQDEVDAKSESRGT